MKMMKEKNMKNQILTLRKEKHSGRNTIRLLFASLLLTLFFAGAHTEKAYAVRTDFGGNGGGGVGNYTKEAERLQKEMEEAKKAAEAAAAAEKKQEEAERKKAEEEAARKAAEEAEKARIKREGITVPANTYILDLTTGLQPGSNISFFIISYNTKTAEGKEEPRSIYVFPGAGDFEEGMEELDEYSSQYGQPGQALNQSYMTYTDAVNKPPTGAGSNSALQANSHNQVIFHTKDAIDKITNVEFFTRYDKTGKTSNEWTCQGLCIYEVSNVFGIDMVGGFSKEYYANFKGKLLADVEFKTGGSDGGFHTYSWNLDKIESFGGMTVKEQDDKGNIKETYRDNLYTSLITEFEDPVYNPGAKDRYGFRIDFADQPNAGLESLSYRSKTDLAGGEYIECLSLKIVYTDVSNKPHILNLPVVTNSLKWAYDNGVKSDIAGVAQPGQSLFFEGNIPKLKSFTSVSLTNGNGKALANCEMTSSAASSATRQVRVKQNEDDPISISLFAIYHMYNDPETTVTAEEGEGWGNEAAVEARVATDGGFLSYDFIGLPIFYRKAETEFGLEVVTGDEIGLQLRVPDEPSDLKLPVTKNDRYLVGVTTDTTPRSGTVGDIRMQFAFTDIKGMNQYTEWYNLNEASTGYYGYWMTEGAPSGNFGYLAGMSPKNTLYFIVTANDVDVFTNAKYELISGADDWQTNGLQIWALDSLSPVKSSWEDVDAQNGDTQLHSEIRFYREFSGINILNIKGTTREEEGSTSSDNSYLPDSVLVRTGETSTWKFKTKGAEQVEEESYAQVTDDMTYDDCLQNFGFAKKRELYTVKVDVSDQAIDLSGNGDCGSQNDFYFQILFENGASAVVLANQQLEGDRFRTGNVETFTIATNKDYGEVTGIRIIPEEVQESSQIDDKLKVNEIRVIRQSNATFNESFIIEHSVIPNDGWIGTQTYMDDAQRKQYNEENKGRMMSEIAVELPVSKKANELNILCCLSLEEYKENTSQFYGEMSMTVDYIKTDGTPASETFDIVNQMYEYYGKAVQHDTDTDSTGKVTTRQPAVSMPSLMFRGGHTDRFMITLKDCKSLYMATLTGQSRGDTSEMNVASLSFNVVETAGELQISGKDEYVRTGETTYITSNSVEISETSKLGNTFGKGQNQKIKIGLLTNEVAPRDEGSKWLAVFSREPVSQNDTLDVYIYPTADSTPIEYWNLYCRASYNNISGKEFTTSLTPMNRHIATDENDKSYFYLSGLNAKAMSTLGELYAVGSTTNGDNNAYIDYAVIQQVRSGTVINTWQRGSTKKMISLGTSMINQSEKTVGLYNQQKVLIQLDPSVAETKLKAEKNDLAVSLRYNTTVDPSGKEVYSAYKYVTDFDITTLYGGDVIEMTFNQPYLKDITGMRIVKVGSVDATVNSMAVINYERSSEKDSSPKAAGWFSFTEPQLVQATPTLVEVTGTEKASPNVVQPLTLKFKTQDAGTIAESGTQSPVRMTIFYEDAYGNAGHSPVIPDIRPYLTDRSMKSFITGETQEVKMLVTGIQNIRYIEIEPYTVGGRADTSTAAAWSVDAVSAQLGDGPVLTRNVGERIYEGTPKRINFQNMSLTVSGYYYSEAANAYETRTITDGDMDFTVASNQPIIFRPTLTGSIMDMDVLIERKVGDTKEMIDATNLLTKKTTTGDKVEYTFTPPRNFTGTNQVYYVTFESQENYAVKCMFVITVQSEALVSENSAGSGNDSDDEPVTGTTEVDTSDGGIDTDPSDGIKVTQMN